MKDLSPAQVRHLVRRTTWGPTPQLMAEASKDPQAWLRNQLAPQHVDDRDCAAMLRRFRTIGWSITRVRTTTPFFNWDTMFELSQATLGRYVFSRRQLLEVMCDFWSNHLNVACPSEKVWDNRHDYDAVVIRRHALGRFSDMLAASAKHPAMLRYLDNASSSGDEPNENYARELMELHTVGPGAGYGEHGVRAAARLLTGATSNWTSGNYEFLPGSHDPSAVRILGFSAPAHPAAEGARHQAAFVGYLARHPATARMIATKLCLRFVSDVPPPRLVSALARTYLSSGTAVAPMLRQLFSSPEFWASQDDKTRRPLEALVATARITGVRLGAQGLGGLDDLYRMSDELGQAPLNWQPPNGYPDLAAPWASAGTTMRRWNQNIALVSQQRPKGAVIPSPSTLLPRPAPQTVGAVVDALARRILGRPATSTERQALLTAVDRGEHFRVGPAWLSSNVPTMTHTLLNAPAHMRR